MLSPNFYLSPEKERAQLLLAGVGLSTIAGAFTVFLNARIFPAVLLLFGLLAFAGAIYHRRMGHDVYLVFALITLVMGRIVSPIVILIAYLLGIGAFGILLRLVRMDKLKRDFIKSKAQPSMLVNPLPTTIESFLRQS